MSNQKIFFLVLFTIVFGVCMLFGLAAQKCDRGHYDEMQQMIRGKAYKVSFFITMIFLAIYFLYDLFWGDSFIRLSSSILAFVAIVLGVTAYISYSIWNNAYIQVNQKGTGIFIVYAVIALINLLAFSMELEKMHLHINNGILEFDSLFIQLGMTVVYGISPIVFLARRAMDKMES